MNSITVSILNLQGVEAKFLQCEFSPYFKAKLFENSRVLRFVRNQPEIARNCAKIQNVWILLTHPVTFEKKSYSDAIFSSFTEFNL